MAMFTEDFMDFFKELSQNNNKRWFDQNRKRYEEYLKTPFYNFVEGMIKKIQADDPEIKITPKESIFNRMMIERVITSALVIGIVAFFLFKTLLDWGYSVDEARNATLLLMVLFENVHVFNCRSETLSIFRHSPLRNRILLFGRHRGKCYDNSTRRFPHALGSRVVSHLPAVSLPARAAGGPAAGPA